MNMKVLIVEDEQAISQVLKVYLRKAGFETEQVFTGSEAFFIFERFQPDLVLLDVMLPGKDGWTILKEIREQSQTPVIMLTALGDTHFKLDGLNGGADDYIAKPFEAEEVVARIKAVLRRVNQPQHAVKQFGALQIDSTAHQIHLHGEEVTLTPRDLSVLLFLAEHPNQTFTRDQLLEHVWGWNYDGSDRAVDLSIKRLRKALQAWAADEGEIRTLRGLGYQLRVQKS